MTSVISTNTPKMEMLTAGSPIVESAAVTATASGTAGLLDTGPLARPARVLVVLEPVAHLVGDGVRVAPRVPHVQLGDEERRHELRQPQQDADVDVAEHLRGHEVVGVGGEQDVEQVP